MRTPRGSRPLKQRSWTPPTTCAVCRRSGSVLVGAGGAQYQGSLKLCIPSAECANTSCSPPSPVSARHERSPARSICLEGRARIQIMVGTVHSPVMIGSAWGCRSRTGPAHTLVRLRLRGGGGGCGCRPTGSRAVWTARSRVWGSPYSRVRETVRPGRTAERPLVLAGGLLGMAFQHDGEVAHCPPPMRWRGR